MLAQPSNKFHFDSPVGSVAGIYGRMRHDSRIPVNDEHAEHEMFGLSEESATVSLPILATASDAREIVRYLKRKPNGVSVVEAMDAEPRRIFDGRKIAAYEFWGIVDRQSERLSLSELGWGLAEKVETECRLYRQILRSIPAYLGAIETIHSNKMKTVTRGEVADYWKGSHPELEFDNNDEKNLEAVSVSFFSLCHAAGLGTLTVGKRGQPARLRMDTEQVDEFLEYDDIPNVFPIGSRFKKSTFSPKANERTDVARIYFSSRRNRSTVENFRSILELAGFEDLACDDASSKDSFLQLEELAQIERCQAAVFLLDRNDCIEKENGGLELSASRLAKINAARALFRDRIIVLWDDPKTSPPASLEQMDTHEFRCNDLNWAEGVELIKLLKKLRA